MPSSAMPLPSSPALPETAPWLRIEQGSRHDRIGSPYYGADGSRDFNHLQPRLYQHTGWSRLQGRWQLSLGDAGPVQSFDFAHLTVRPTARDLAAAKALRQAIWVAAIVTFRMIVSGSLCFASQPSTCLARLGSA